MTLKEREDLCDQIIEKLIDVIEIEDLINLFKEDRSSYLSKLSEKDLIKYAKCLNVYD